MLKVPNLHDLQKRKILRVSQCFVRLSHNKLHYFFLIVQISLACTSNTRRFSLYKPEKE